MNNVIITDAGYLLRRGADKLVLRCHVVPGEFVEVYGNGKKIFRHHVGDASKVGMITSITKKNIVVDGWLNLAHSGFAFRAI